MIIRESIRLDPVFISNMENFQFNKIREKGIKKNYRWKESKWKWYLWFHNWTLIHESLTFILTNYINWLRDLEKNIFNLMNRNFVKFLRKMAVNKEGHLIILPPKPYYDQTKNIGSQIICNLYIISIPFTSLSSFL